MPYQPVLAGLPLLCDGQPSFSHRVPKPRQLLPLTAVELSGLTKHKAFPLHLKCRPMFTKL